MISFLEKFIAAFICVIVVGVVLGAGLIAIVGVISGWIWVVHHLPVWGQWIFNTFATVTIIAFVMAVVSHAHDEDR